MTKIISKDSASISMLIPMVKIFEKAFNKHEDDSGIQAMKGEMLKSLETRVTILKSQSYHLFPLVWTLDLRTNFF